FDLIGIAFFLLLFWYGIAFTGRGMSRVTMIYAIPKGYAYAGVPLAALLAAVQLGLMAIHDGFSQKPPEHSGSMTVGGPD
ncbi:MAG: hypothetical protein KDJ77_11025, partial [Rhodobiaceae bacterium]|nr:hypothetical protein [Rhodobiaceae bacterium]